MATVWRTDTPQPGTQAWVWNFVAQELAPWDGRCWRNAAGAELVGVTHWRPVVGATA